MKNTHLCFTSHKEVLFRNEADMNTWFNCFCSALYKTDSICYTDSTLSDHFHTCCRTQYPSELIKISRDSYAKKFNNKYLRKGSLGDEGFFIQELDGLQQLLAAMTYTICNAKHHGVVASPFEYKYCSINSYFRKQLGKNTVPDRLLTPEEIRKVLPKRAEYNPSWKMNIDGVFLRESVMDVETVEVSYGTAQAFNYYIGRKSGPEWKKEQEVDGKEAITLESFESGLIEKDVSKEKSLSSLLRNERSRTAVFAIDDLALCEIIDNQYVPQMGCKSVYSLTESQKNAIANELYKKYYARISQLRRCLVF